MALNEQVLPLLGLALQKDPNDLQRTPPGRCTFSLGSPCSGDRRHGFRAGKERGPDANQPFRPAVNWPGWGEGQTSAQGPSRPHHASHLPGP